MRVLTFVVTCDYIDFWTLCFAHHFVYCCHFTRFLIKFFACLYLTTMQILWARKYEYGVLFITHAREIFKSLVFDSWLENSSSICDEQNTILTFPPHSIYTWQDLNTMTLFLAECRDLGGQIHPHGARFSPKACVQCHCDNGHINCTRQDPIRNCPKLR